MTIKSRILALSGSIRQYSTNQLLINAIADLYADQLDIVSFHGLAEIPHFNPDLDTDKPPQAVIDFRMQLKEADAILICTPEYAMGVPGTLKNAIDWTVSSMEFSQKPVALITASSAGQKAHVALIETLMVIECDMPKASRLLISYVKTKVNDGQIVDRNTLEQVESVMNSLIDTIAKRSI